MAVATEAAAGRGRPWRLFKIGWLTGVLYFGGTLYWVYGVMAAYGGFSVWIAVGIAVLLACYQAAYVGLFAIVLGTAVRRLGPGGVWLAPCAWVVTEWSRARIGVGGGFAWGMLGASQSTVAPVVQLASVTGVYGLSALVVLVGTAAAALTVSRRRRTWWAAGAVALLLVGIAMAGTWRLSRPTLRTEGQPLRVGLVQGNIEQVAKWDPAYRDAILARYLELSRQALSSGAQLVLWPESSTPFFFDLQSDLAQPVRRLAEQAHTPFLIGSDQFEARGPGLPNLIYNAAVLVGSDGRTHGAYRKMRLVPFGEYVPLKSLLFFVGPLVESVSDFTEGTDPVVFDADGRRFSVSICYEVVYPEISRSFVQRGSQLLATITNDAWFGRTSAAYQHFDQAILRAVENGRYLVRAANTGISGAVDPYGRVLARTRLFETMAITADVRLLDATTIYTRAGDVVVWVSLAALLPLLPWPGRSRAAGRV